MVTRLVRAPRIDFAGLRHELDLPTQFPLAAQREADEAAGIVAGMLTAAVSARAAGAPPATGALDTLTPATDCTDIPLVTIDPATSRDLDQAMCLRRIDSGYRVFYAIADVTSFVSVGGELEAETWRRGETVYLPDGNVPLHPLSLSEGAASLLPGQTRPAVLWTIDLDRDGEITATRVRRAVVRSREKLDYVGVQAASQAGTLNDSIALLPEIGRILVGRGLARGAVNLPIPEQEVEPDGAGWRLVLRAPQPAEEWNAQISLLTGMAAAAVMLSGGIGLLRTMPAPHPDAISRLRTAAAGLGIDWPDGVGLGAVLAAVDPASPPGAALIDQAAELMLGAGYTAFAGSAPAEPGHGAVAAPYAHVTAPLRRLADRYATEVCLCLTDGLDVPQWVQAALPHLPEVMQRSGHRASAAERGAVDLAEAVTLAGRVGEEFDAVVVDADGRHNNEHHNHDSDPAGTVALQDPPVRARCRGTLPLGERIRVRLVKADPAQRSVAFEAVPS